MYDEYQLTRTYKRRDMMTTMSAIVYSHYVEALTPGTFQHNMSEMFKLNGLKPVNFPTPP